MSGGEVTDWQEEWHSIWSILSCKWTFHILRLLSIEDHGFNDMKREIDGITASMLSRRLKQLEEGGAITREVIDASPPQTNYSLSESGEKLASLLLEIEQLRPFSDD